MYYCINCLSGSILGPVTSLEIAEEQLKLVEYPKEWIIVKSVNIDY